MSRLYPGHSDPDDLAFESERLDQLFDLADEIHDAAHVLCIGCRRTFAERDLIRKGPALVCPTCAPGFDARGRRLEAMKGGKS